MAEPGQSTAPPPAPPPPPPAVLGTPKIFSSGQRSSANSKHVVSVPATQPSQRPPFAGVHPETLQHAAASLRKTQHREPLFSCEPSSLLGRPNELPDRRYRSDFTEYETVAQHPSGTTVYAPPNGAPQSGPIDFVHGRFIPLNDGRNSADINDARSTSNNQVYGGSNTTYSSNNNTVKTNYNNNVGGPVIRQIPIKLAPSNQNVNSNYSSTYSNNFSTPLNNNEPIGSNFSNFSTVINDNKNSFIAKPVASSNFSTNNNFTTNNHFSTNNNFTTREQSSCQTTTKTRVIDGDKNNNYNNNFMSHTISPTIRDPQAYIHNYATNTPVATIPEFKSDVLHQSSFSTTTTKNQRPAYDFARELRDSGLTERQKYSNQFQKSVLTERPTLPNSIRNLRQEAQKHTTNTPYASVDALINDMECQMNTAEGDVCKQCHQEIVGETPGVTALGNAYHVTCFTCDVCRKQLAGCSFYNVDGKNLCQVDYMNSLEKCEKCATPITQKILRAMGKPFHPECFACPSCGKSLDGIPFTVDKQNQAFCLDCYHERFSPRCAACLKAIAPVGNETEVARVIAMDRSYHIDCYKCEDCGLRLNSKVEGQGCYPLESHLLCKNCNLKRLKNTYQPTTATA